MNFLDSIDDDRILAILCETKELLFPEIMKYKYTPVQSRVGLHIENVRNYMSKTSGFHWKIDEIGFSDIVAHPLGEPDKKQIISHNDMRQYFRMVVVDN